MVLLSVNSIKGKRNYMEDRYSYIEEYGIIVAMICDGHGGYQASQQTVKDLPYIILNKMFNTSGNNLKHSKVLKNTICEWGESIKNYNTGSTLTGIVIKDNTIYIYNIGDSRTCFIKNNENFIYYMNEVFNDKGEPTGVINLDYKNPEFFCTKDHDTFSKEEKERIINSSGFIIDDRLNGKLSVTRALGDNDIGKGLSYVPDIYWLNKNSVLGPILMYSDGLYELNKNNSNGDFSDENLYSLSNFYKDTSIIVNHAMNKGSEDNLTAMLIDF